MIFAIDRHCISHDDRRITVRVRFILFRHRKRCLWIRERSLISSRYHVSLSIFPHKLKIATNIIAYENSIIDDYSV
uniref:Uncharacterized protein n=1 Tax=Ascaris lumbricoides TaxID=6252 RepID=A0A0M3HJY3_ASCLU